MDKKSSDMSRIMKYAGNKRVNIYISAVLCAFSALAALVPFYYVWKIIKGVIYEYDAEQLKTNGWLALLYAAISVIFYIVGLAFSYKAAMEVSSNIKKHTIRHLAHIPLGEVHRFGSGKLRKIITDSSETIEKYVSYQLPDKVCTIATPVGLIFMLFAFDWRFGMLSLISLVLGIVLLVGLMARGLTQIMKDYQDSMDQMSSDAVEYVRGIPVVKTFGQSISSFHKFKGSIDQYEKFVIAYMKRMRAPMVAYAVAIYSVFVFLIVGGVMMGMDGMSNKTLCNLIFYVVFTPAIALMMSRFMYQSKSAIFVKDAFERLDTILNIEVMSDTDVAEKSDKTNIVLENISFSYDGKKQAVSDVSLEIKEGQTVAFVGASGSGKSTLANLIARFYDVGKGNILIGGVNVKDISEQERMSKISYVFQDSHMLQKTLLDNVRLGKPEASREEVLLALENAQCMDIVEKLSNGVDTIIGSEGVHLSGGEIQRLAIARAFLKNTPILILDEATAYADPDNEKKVQIALEKLSKGKTVIMIAHRLSTIQDVDCIYVLGDGKVLESGTSKMLLDKQGIYFNMWEEYCKSADWKITSSYKKGAVV